ncbi:unnamed protein product [Adineta ricciae]|uniref:CCHC-type domain-containing protein n=1 Tax=Adineta ricciae TaxID=249248 RepID=A0A814SM79_ADIRI|nr:unnamed protein product [Adineta ricciae]CAF1149322.1 unnamed protein product [Adineta ricciae]
MPGKQSSDRSSTSSAPTRRPPTSLIVSQVAVTESEASLRNDLSRNYPDVKDVYRNFDKDGHELNSIRVDFSSTHSVSNILYDQRIYIHDQAHYIRPYWPIVCYKCRTEGHIATECPKQSVSQQRLDELLNEQNHTFQTMIANFETRWNERITGLKPQKQAEMSQLTSILNDASKLCQQINQYNSQVQTQLSSIVSRVQDLQKTVNNQ